MVKKMRVIHRLMVVTCGLVSFVAGCRLSLPGVKRSDGSVGSSIDASAAVNG